LRQFTYTNILDPAARLSNITNVAVTDMTQINPLDEEIQSLVSEIRLTNPTIGLQKLLAAIKAQESSWSLSEKVCLPSQHSLLPPFPTAFFPPPPPSHRLS